MDAHAVTELLQRHGRLIHKVAFVYCDASFREDVVHGSRARWR